MRRAAIAGAVAAALALGASASAQESNFFAISFGPAGARDLKSWDLPVRWEGTVVVRFQGAFGDGRIVWTPGRQGQFTVAQYRTRKGRQMDAFLASTGGSSASARVQSATGVCTDTGASLFDAAAISPVKSGVQVALAGPTAAAGGFHMTETRCGGPLFDDVGRALGSVHISRRQLAKGGFDIDLRGSAPLAVPGMQGSVDSTVVAHVARRRATPTQVERPVPGGGPFDLAVRYRVERVSGTLSAAVAGGGNLCAELDSCGRSETLTLRAGAPSSGTVQLHALTAKRSGLSELRTALGLRRGRARAVPWNGFGSWNSNATTLAAVMSDTGGELCRDERSLSSLGLQLTPIGSRVRAELTPDQTGVARTSCPGPALASPEGRQVVASGSVPRSALRRDRVTFHLTSGAALETDGWSGQTTPDITVVIRRTSVKVEKLG
jgi:hypothetical protein